MKFFTVLFFVLTCSTHNFQAQSFCSDADKASLKLIWESFNQPNLANWNFDLSPNIELDDSWEGITMTSNGCNISQIVLVSKNISGVIANAIGDLTELTVINLKINDINGWIPASVVNLSNLKILNLDYNYIEGIIPSDIGNLIQLEELSLRDCTFYHIIPLSIANLANLKILNINSADLTPQNFPTQIFELEQLETLSLSSCNLTGNIPYNLQNMDNLEHLSLQLNDLSNSGGSLYLPSGLKTLYLGLNDFSGNIFPELVELTSVEIVDLTSNNFSGSIPSSISQLVSLQRLSFSFNNISGVIPSELGTLPNLKVLNGSYNSLDSPLPYNLLLQGQLPIEVDLKGNDFNECIPASYFYYCDDDKEMIIYNSNMEYDDFDLFCSDSLGICDESYDFVTTWKTDNSGVSNNTSIGIPTHPESIYYYDVDWEDDGIFDDFGVSGNIIHDYGISGEYTVRIRGLFPRIHFDNSFDNDKIIAVEQWGKGRWTSMDRAFAGCSNLFILANDNPDLTKVTNMSGMFRNAIHANHDFSDWEIRYVTDMTNIFFGVTLSTLNYDKLLISWSEQLKQDNVNFHGGNSKYCAGGWARYSLVNDFGWIIQDGGTCGSDLTLDLTTMLEGPYQIGQFNMSADIVSHFSFPLLEPYENWGYHHVVGGTEVTTSSVKSQIGDEAIVDWVFVTLYDGSDPNKILETKSALLRSDGRIVTSSDGNSALQFLNPNGLYDEVLISIEHRNHFGLKLLDPITLIGSNQTISVDFSDLNIALLGGENAGDEVDDLRLQISGDANGDGEINAVDKNIAWRPQNGTLYNYSTKTADFNLDRFVNTADKNFHWRTNNGKTVIFDH